MITLIRPPMAFSKTSFSAPVTPALALGYLAAFLQREGHKVTCIDAVGEAIDTLREHPKYDAFIRGLSFDEVIAKIPSESSFIGISTMFSQEWLVVKELIVLIRKSFPKAIIIVGGEHATALSDFIMKDCPAIDIVCMGEGEETLLSIIEDFKTKPREVAGIVYKKGSLIIKNAPRKRIRELDALPRPAWDSLPLKAYHESGYACGISNGRAMPIIATRGCPYECTFCSNPGMWGTKYHVRKPEDVVDEIETYVNKYAVTNIEFYDLTAIISKRWIVSFCQEYKRRNLNVAWTLPSGTRSEALDKEVLTLLKETNCKYLVYAAESGSMDTLIAIKKRIKLGNFLQSIRMAKKIGLILRCNLIIGLPSETRWDVIKTLFFQFKLAIIGVDDLPLYFFSPYPGSELFHQLQQNGQIPVLSDSYFTDLMSQIDIKNARSYNLRISGKELSFYRFIGMSSSYAAGYLLHPKRIYRSLQNIFIHKKSDTVFEQRIIEFFSKIEQIKNLRSSTDTKLAKVHTGNFQKDPSKADEEMSKQVVNR